MFICVYPFCVHYCLSICVFSCFRCLLCSFVDFPSVLWYCWLGLLTCKNRLPYNLYCVGGDVKHCTIQSVWGSVDIDLVKARSHSALRERRYAPLAARSAATRLFICGWTRLKTVREFQRCLRIVLKTEQTPIIDVFQSSLYVWRRLDEGVLCTASATHYGVPSASKAHTADKMADTVKSPPVSHAGRLQCLNAVHQSTAFNPFHRDAPHQTIWSYKVSNGLFGIGGSALVSINVVTLHRARLIIGWVTVYG